MHGFLAGLTCENMRCNDTADGLADVCSVVQLARHLAGWLRGCPFAHSFSSGASSCGLSCGYEYVAVLQ